MRMRTWLFIAVLLGLAGAVGMLSRCFNPDLPACSYICNPTEPRCPDEYECRADNYCHLRGSPTGDAGACPFKMDLSLPLPPPDMSSGSDAGPDGGSDAGSSDGATDSGGTD